MEKMRFVDFREVVKAKFDEIVRETIGEIHTNRVSSAQTERSLKLFMTNVDPDTLYAVYQAAFPANRNMLFRKAREHECSTCKNFIRHIGALVRITDDYRLESIWDVKVPDPAYQEVADKMAKTVKDAAIGDVFLSASRIVGAKCNFEISADDPEHPRQWDHFFAEVPTVYVSHELSSDLAKYRGKAEVFERSLTMIGPEPLDFVLELIAQNNLYRGLEKKDYVEKFKAFKERYDALDDDQRKLFVWKEGTMCSDVISHFKNDVIGTLLTDLSSGMDADEAVRLYESKVAPENYQRSKPIYSQKQLDAARAKLEELGYMKSLERRFATIDDLTIRQMIFVNRDAKSTTVAEGTAESFFQSMEKSLAIDPRKFANSPKLPIQQFMGEVLPTATDIELLFESTLAKNMVSLIAPAHPDAKSLFKWPAPFSWAYTGNMTDSSLKQNVKAAGGDVTGDLRFSIQWNDGGDHDQNDLDAHCLMPNGIWHIYYGAKHDMRGGSGGALDVDIQRPEKGVPAVENITFPDRKRMPIGNYQFIVHNYANRGGTSGFRAEIEFDGTIHSFDYATPLRQGEQVPVATVALDASGNFTMVPHLDSKIGGGRTVWNLTTNQFIPVTAIMQSPNYWPSDDPNATIVVNYGPTDKNLNGARHLFFMLKDCVNPEQPNPFFNEFLNDDLHDFRRVMEALGTKAKVATVDDQLSGVGFAYTQHATAIVRVNGDRVYRIQM